MPNNTIDWGQGAANNSIGWGAGAVNNSRDWGYIHSRSYGHDETNLTGLLSFFQQFGTPDAAYSLRDLSGNNPNVVRVRRSSDNAEQDFKEPEITDGSLIGFVGGGNDGFVTTWYDQTGANDATQATASAQPKIVNAGALIMKNGLPAFRLDGSDDTFSTTFNPSGSTDLAFFGVTEVDELLSGSARQPILAISTLTMWMRFRELSVGTLDFRINDGTNVFDANVSVSGETYPLHNLTTLENANNVFKGYINALSTGNVNSAAFTGLSSGNLAIGQRITGGYFKGLMQELILYTEDKSAEREDLTANINDYYSIY